MTRLELRPGGCSPLWDVSHDTPRALDPSELAIDESLRTRLAAWSELCTREQNRRRTRSSLAMTVRLVVEGEWLQGALSRALGPQVELQLAMPEHLL